MFAVFYEDSITSEFNIFLKKKPLKAVDELLVSVYYIQNKLHNNTI